MPSQPDRQAALRQYRRRAAVYDLELALFEPVRRRAVARLGLGRGDTVLDIACGTGLSLALLRGAVGPGGRVVGIEQSPEMIERARRRVAEQGWHNVQLVLSPVEEAALGLRADAALFHFTHDVLRRPEAVANVLRHLKPGARVVASGLKWTGRRWAWPANLLVLAAARRSVTSLAGLAQPWSTLVPALARLEVEPLLLDTVYLVAGDLAPKGARRGVARAAPRDAARGALAAARVRRR
jgi:ubiquinone/menaquinone biosynthesis C-methylase UbiE